MNMTQSAFAVAIMATVTIFVRFLPFIVFRNNTKIPKSVLYLGKTLPPAIMAMLVVYCLKGIKFDSINHFLPEAIASAVVAVSYFIKKSTLVSIALGTVCYMLLVQLVFV